MQKLFSNDLLTVTFGIWDTVLNNSLLFISLSDPVLKFSSILYILEKDNVKPRKNAQTCYCVFNPLTIKFSPKNTVFNRLIIPLAAMTPNGPKFC